MTHEDKDSDAMAVSARDEASRYSRLAMAWHGWGSPVGLGVFLVGLGAAALLMRLAIAGL